MIKIIKIFLEILIITVFLLPNYSCANDQMLFPDLAFKVAEKSHSEIITKSPYSWKITVNSETPIENESIVIEVLDGMLENPSLKPSGNVDYLSLKAIVEDVVSQSMTEEQKALALWRFVMDNTYHGSWGTCFDSLEHLNVYGYGYCGTFVAALEPLWWAAGLRARHVNIGNHAATEVYYDNDWHYIDAHRRCFFLERDNQTIASLEDLNNDLQLWDLKRWVSPQKGEKKYYYMSMHPQGHGSAPEYSRDFTIAKGEILTLTWQKSGKWCFERGAEGGKDPAPEPTIYANGIFRFWRDLSDSVQSHEGIVSSRNIDWNDFEKGYLHPLRIHEDANLVYKVRVPYFIPSAVISGKFLRKDTDDMIAIDISTNNGQNWVNLWTADKTDIINAKLTTDRTQEVTTDKLWKYSYLLRIRMRAGKSVHDVGVYSIESTNALFYNPRSLPGMKNGENTLIFKDKGKAPHSVKVTYRWAENLPIRVSKESPLEGEEITLSAQVSNVGKGEARNTPIVLYLGDPHGKGFEIGRDFIKSIEPGKVAFATVRWKTTRKDPHGNEQTTGATICAVIDPAGVIRESDKSTNTFCRVIKVLNPPDVSIPSESFITFKSQRDNPHVLTIQATVRNFSNSANYGYYLNDHAEATGVVIKFFDGEPQKRKQIGTNQVIESLKPLEFKNVSVDWDISKLNRQHKIYVQVFTPENVIQAFGPKKPEEISTAIDLDVYRECMADRE